MLTTFQVRLGFAACIICAAHAQSGKFGDPAVDKLFELAQKESKFDDEISHLKAIDDLTTAMTLKPGNARLCLARGIEESEAELYGAAIADLTAAIHAQPTYQWIFSYSRRGLAYELEGDFGRAADDYQSALYLAGKNDEFDRRRLFMLRQRQHIETESTGFREWVKSQGPGWPSILGRFLTGEMSEPALFSAAKKGILGQGVRVYAFQSFYYAGMGRLLLGDKAMARRYFESCMALHLNFDEFYLIPSRT